MAVPTLGDVADCTRKKSQRPFMQLAPEKIESPAQQRELAEHRAEDGSIVAPEVGDGLEVWLQGSQQPMTSMLRWHSASSRRLDRTRRPSPLPLRRRCQRRSHRPPVTIMAAAGFIGPN
jgi:hypothetical protein